MDQSIPIIHRNLFILDYFGRKSFYFGRKRQIAYSQYTFDLTGSDFDKFVDRGFMK